MAEFSILDCTFRDGGYYTNWDFSEKLLSQYLGVISQYPIDYIEIGYRSIPDSGYWGLFFYTPIELIDAVRAEISAEQKLAIMLNGKDCMPDDIPHLLRDVVSKVSLIRIAIDPDKIQHAISLADAIKQMGFDVAINLMYLMKFIHNPSLLETLRLIPASITIVNLVDSYGSCFPEMVEKIIPEIKKVYSGKIGFHGHDNIGLAFANSLAALRAGAEIIDSTVLGMGRGAGNLRTELLLAHKISQMNWGSDLAPLSELVDSFQQLQKQYQWGSGLPYIISGLANLPQKEVMEWVGKRRYSTGSIVQALQGRKMDIFDHSEFPEISTFANICHLSGRSCLIIGGGKSARDHLKYLKIFAKANDCIVVHSSSRNVGLFGDFLTPQFLCLAGDELRKIKKSDFPKVQKFIKAFVVAKPPRAQMKIPAEINNFVFQTSCFSQTREVVVFGNDSPLELALSASLELGTKEVFLAGFDGYFQGDSRQRELLMENQKTINSFREKKCFEVFVSITATNYEIAQESVFAWQGKRKRCEH